MATKFTSYNDFYLAKLTKAAATVCTYLFNTIQKKGTIESDGNSWITIPARCLANVTNLTERTVYAATAQLEELGFLLKETKGQGEGDMTMSYAIDMEAFERFVKECYQIRGGSKKNVLTRRSKTRSLTSISEQKEASQKPKTEQQTAAVFSASHPEKKPASYIYKQKYNSINYIRGNFKKVKRAQEQPEYNSHQGVVLEIYAAFKSLFGDNITKSKKLFAWIAQALKKFFGNDKKRFLNYIFRLGKSKYWLYVQSKKFFTNIFSFLRFDFIKRILEQTEDDLSCEEPVDELAVEAKVQAHQERHKDCPAVFQALQRLRQKMGKMAYMTWVTGGGVEFTEEKDGVVMRIEQDWRRDFFETKSSILEACGIKLHGSDAASLLDSVLKAANAFSEASKKRQSAVACISGAN